MNLSENELKEIEARASNATEGPWEIAHLPSPGNDVGRVGPYVYSKYLGAVAITPADSGVYSNIGGNYAFIAHARTDIPRLLSALRTAQAELAAAKAETGGIVTALRKRFIKQDPRSPSCDFCALCGTKWTRGQPENHSGPVPGMTPCLLGPASKENANG